MRITNLTKAILELLQDSAQPISVPEILKKLNDEKGLKPNKTTLYRQFQKLTQENKVEEVLLTNNVTHYELKKDHHHHFICNECDTIQCLEDKNLEGEIHKLEQILEQQGLQIEQHQFSFSGSCQKCTK